VGGKQSPERIYQEFISENRNNLMLNAGLLGGTREDVMAIAHGIIRLYYLTESNRFWKKEQAAQPWATCWHSALWLIGFAIGWSLAPEYIRYSKQTASVRSLHGGNTNDSK
jgi:hypothetical protein